MNIIMARAYCHKIIKLSPVIQSLAPEKETVCNVHGVREKFLEVGQEYAHKVRRGCGGPGGGWADGRGAPSIPPTLAVVVVVVVAVGVGVVVVVDAVVVFLLLPSTRCGGRVRDLGLLAGKGGGAHRPVARAYEIFSSQRETCWLLAWSRPFVCDDGLGAGPAHACKCGLPGLCSSIDPIPVLPVVNVNSGRAYS